MPTRVSPTNPIRFGDFEVDLQSGRLFKQGVKVPLREQSFQVLASLLEHAGEVVTREDLQRRLWPNDVFVDFDNNLNTAIARLRVALGDSAEHPRFIETLPKRGYCFIDKLSEPVVVRLAPRRIVVLPFLNLLGDSEQEYLSVALTEELITELSTLAPEDLLVIARTTTMRYQHTEKDVAQICSELRVDYLIEGSVRHEDDRIAISLQLIRANDQMHLFAHRYDSDIGTMFSLRTTMAEAIAQQIGINSGASGQTPQRAIRPTADSVAYNLYLKGRFHILNETAEGISKAKTCFEEAISQDPGFALAYDALGELHWYLGFMGVAPAKDVFTPGMFYATRALEIDSTLAETHALLAMYRKELDYDWAEVKREMDLARDLGPNSPLVRVRYAASWLLAECRLEDACAEIELALESDPQSTFMRSWLAVILWLNRNYERALEQGRMIIEFDPRAYMGYWVIGMAYREKGEFTEAIDAHRKAVQLSGRLPLLLGWLGLALGQGGNAEEARAMLQQFHGMAKTRYVPPTSFAWTHFGLGDIDEAFIWMDRAVEARDHMMIPIKSYPFFDTIREDARYHALLRKMKYNTDGPGTNYSAKASKERTDDESTSHSYPSGTS